MTASSGSLQLARGSSGTFSTPSFGLGYGRGYGVSCLKTMPPPLKDLLPILLEDEDHLARTGIVRVAGRQESYSERIGDPLRQLDPDYAWLIPPITELHVVLARRDTLQKCAPSAVGVGEPRSEEHT